MTVQHGQKQLSAMSISKFPYQFVFVKIINRQFRYLISIFIQTFLPQSFALAVLNYEESTGTLDTLNIETASRQDHFQPRSPQHKRNMGHNSRQNSNLPYCHSSQRDHV